LRTKNEIISLAGRACVPRAGLRLRTITHSMERHPTKAPGTTSGFAVELFRGENMGSGIEAVVGQESNLKTALVLYNLMVAHYPGRLIILCDGARVLARSDRLDTMTANR
jgi:hypothetical protein